MAEFINGVGVIIPNYYNEILCVHRVGKHAPGWSIPGGKIKLGRSPEQTAYDESLEELGIKLKHVRFVGFVPDMHTVDTEGVMPMSMIFVARQFTGTPAIQPGELDKLDDLNYFDPEDLPKPHVSFSREAVANWVGGIVYSGIWQGEPYEVYGGESGLV